MNKIIKDRLYSVRWAVSSAIETGDMSKVDYASDQLAQAKADYITEDIEPERPSEAPVDSAYDIPAIVRVPGVKFATHGSYRTDSGRAKGLIVHYTVSGRTARSAKGVLNYLARKGLGCMVMDEDGIIYIPENFNLERDVAWHAGKSEWRGVTGLSRYAMGMEICCWGKDSKVGPFRDSTGEKNIKKGKYQAYTSAQELSLKNFCKWQLAVNPAFDVDWVAGHDEVAPNRKQDPGASLSMPMDEFRASLR